jgi:hypothetical protein
MAYNNMRQKATGQAIADEATVQIVTVGHARYNWRKELLGFAVCAAAFLAFIQFIVVPSINGR